MSSEKKSFFISYTGKDEDRAKWATKTLEDAGYSAIIQARDFLVGTHFPENMDQALNNTNAVLTIISDAYLKSDFCRSEWLTAYRQDRSGGRRYIIPVRVEEVVPEGLLNRDIYIDIFGEMDEGRRKKVLLEGVKNRLTKLERGEESDEEGEGDRFWKNEITVKSLPFCRNGYFTGREQTLADIRDIFSKPVMPAPKTVTHFSHPITVIGGLGGVGKTEIALEYCYRNMKNYHTLWWINAEDSFGLASAYKKLGDKKQILTGDEKDDDDIREKVRSWLENNSGYLLVYDNVEAATTIAPYLPREVPGNIIITSRDIRIAAALEQEHAAINIDVLDAEDAAAFLVKRARKTDAGADELTERLGRLSLALEHAAAYILSNNISFSDYLELLTRSGLEIFDANEDKNKRYLRTVNSTWRISIEKIKNKSAAQLLKMCAYMASERIVLFIFGLEESPSPLKVDWENKLKRNAIIRELTRYSLLVEEIVPDEEQIFADKTFAMHRLLQETVRMSIRQDTLYIECCLDLMENVFGYEPGSKSGKEQFLGFLPHGLSVADHASMALLSGKEKQHVVCDLYNRAGYGIYELERAYSRSLGLFEKALALADKFPGFRLKYKLYTNIANMNLYQGDQDKALEIFIKGLEYVENENSWKKEEVKVAFYQDIGQLYNFVHDAENAEFWFKKALDVCEMLDPPNKKGLANIYSGLLQIYLWDKNYKEAAAVSEKSIIFKEEMFGTTHPDTAISYFNYGVLCFEMKHYKKAMEYFNRALAIQEEFLGDTPVTANTYRQIGNVYALQGKNKTALEYYKKALEIQEEKMGSIDVNTAATYCDLGDIYYGKKDYDTALEWYFKAVPGFENIYGSDHLRTGFLYNNIAYSCYLKEDYKNSLLWYRKAAFSYGAVYGKKDMKTARIYRYISTVLYELEKYREAERYAAKALPIFEEENGTENEETVDIKNFITECRYRIAGGS
jgi:tetratricopeptide (TPR) repeat protein